MARGEDFVLRQLTARARERQRWRDAPIVLAACLAGLLLLWRPEGRRRLAAFALHGPPAGRFGRHRGEHKGDRDE